MPPPPPPPTTTILTIATLSMAQASLYRAGEGSGVLGAAGGMKRGRHMQADMHAPMAQQAAAMQQYEHAGMDAPGMFGAMGPHPYAAAAFGQMQGHPSEPGVSHVELELELQLRGNLLVQQQRRIVQLENELQKTWQQMEYLRMQLQAQDRQHKEARPVEKKAQSRYWTPEEHARFLEALEKFGPKEVRAISQYVGSRTTTQVRTHAQKFYLKLQKEEKLAAERAAKAKAAGGAAADGEDSRASKRRRTRSSRMQMPADLSSIPRRTMSGGSSTASGTVASAAPLGTAPAAAGEAAVAAAAAATQAAAKATAMSAAAPAAATSSGATPAPAPASAAVVSAPAVATAAAVPPLAGSAPSATNQFKVSLNVHRSSGAATPVRHNPAASAAPSDRSGL